MINQEATLKIHPDGAVMLVIAPTNMDKNKITVLSIEKTGKVLIGQEDQWFVEVHFDVENAEKLLQAPEIEILEVSEYGIELHENIRRV